MHGAGCRKGARGCWASWPSSLPGACMFNSQGVHIDSVSFIHIFPTLTSTSVHRYSHISHTLTSACVHELHLLHIFIDCVTYMQELHTHTIYTDFCVTCMRQPLPILHAHLHPPGTSAAMNRAGSTMEAPGRRALLAALLRWTSHSTPRQPLRAQRYGLRVGSVCIDCHVDTSVV